MGVRVIHVLTHDSIGLGEDGPTHQPVEHLAALRAIPNLLVFRPCDTVETIECWQLALEARTSPSVLALTRQNLPLIRTVRGGQSLRGRRLRDCSGARHRAGLAVRDGLGSLDRRRGATSRRARGRGAGGVGPLFRVCCSPRRRNRRAIVGTAPVQVAVEAAVRQGWDAVIGSDGVFVGMTGFGASAPDKDLYRHFGITPEDIAEAAFTKLSKG